MVRKLNALLVLLLAVTGLLAPTARAANGDVWADFSGARPTISQLQAAGVRGVFRYLPTSSAGAWKAITATEYNSYINAGVDVALNWESTSARANEGYAAGVADATQAKSEALALQYPMGAALYFSEDTGRIDITGLLNYFAGVDSVLAGTYSVGVYGGYDAINVVTEHGLATYGWQTLAWSYGRISRNAQIYQNGRQLFGGGADIDVILTGTVGGALAHLEHAYYPPAPTPAPVVVTPSPRVCSVVVQRGDTLTVIAHAHSTTPARLGSINHIRDLNRIYVGERITLPGCSASAPAPAKAAVITHTYTVHSGDSLSAIGTREHEAWRSIAAKNHITYPYRIYPGEQLRI